jgi:WD40 repeat protein/tetratricopeptide (TPR) repeat protein
MPSGALMPCPTQDRLRQFLADRLDRPEAEAIEAHVQGCGACQQALELLTGSASGATERLSRPDDGRDRLHGLLREAAQAKTSGPEFLQQLEREPPTGVPLSLGWPPLAGRTTSGIAGLAAAATLPAVPGYELLGEVGRGGMGVVYKAHQQGLNRIVALKVILAGPYASAEQLVRFRWEAELAARLVHPHIVQIYGVGTHEGYAYLAMEYVEGGTLGQHTAGKAQPPREAARLAEFLARAVGFAHERGIIHRDLKPGNVLLTPHGVPKVADFGLAKVVGFDTGLTQTGVILGTPAYMAPEQATGKGQDTGPAADIYALGAILYELLSGRPPFTGSNLLSVLDQVEEREPPSLRSGSCRCPRDLETICLKCLRKDPGQRYASALDLAEDLRRFLAGEPILARRVPRVERAWRWCRRNPREAGLVLAVAASLLLGTAAALVFAVRAERNARDAQEQLWRSMLNEARGIRLSGRRGQRFDALARLRQALALARRQGALSTEDRDRFRAEATACLVLPDVEVEQEWDGWPPGSNALVFDDALGLYARVMLADDYAISIRRVRNDTEVARLPGEGPPQTMGLAFSPDGRRVLRRLVRENTLQLWSLDADTPALRWQRPGANYAYFHPDGRSLLVGLHDDTSLLLDAATGREQRRLPQGTTQWGACFHPTLPRAVLGQGNEVRVVDLETGCVLWSDRFPGPIDCLAWHPAGRMLALKSGAIVQLYDGATGRKLRTLQGPVNSGMAFRFDPSGELLLSTEWSGQLRFWDPRTGRQLFSTPSKMGDRLFVRPRLDRDGATVGGEMAGTRMRLLHVPPRYLHTILGEDADTRWSALSPDGRWLVFAGHTATYWQDLTGAAETALLPVGEAPLGFDSSGRALLTRGRHGLVRWPFDPADGTVGPPERLLATTAGETWSATPSHETIAIPLFGSGAEIWHRGRPEHWTYVEPQHDVRHVALSPDGRWVVTGSHVTGTVTVADARTGRRRKHLLEQGGWGLFSPDGQWLAVGGFMDGGRLWRVEGWEPGTELDESYFAFSPDSRLVAVGGTGHGVLRLLECQSGREVARLETPEQTRLLPSLFTADGGGLLVAAHETRSLSLWDLRGLRAELKSLDLDWDWPELPPPAPTAAAGPDQIHVRGADLLPDPDRMARHVRAQAEDVLKKDPADPLARARLGGALLREKRYLEALTQLSLALWLRPDLLDAHCNRALVLSRLGLDRLAADEATRALEQSPGYTRALGLRFRALQRLGRQRAAVDDLGVLIERFPEDYLLRELRAAAYDRLGRPNEALPDRRKAQALTANDPQGLNTLAWELATAVPEWREPARAVELARRAVELAPRDAMIRNTLGVALYRAGRYPEAIVELEKSLALGKGEGQSSPFDLFTLALCHARLRDPAKARDCYRRALHWMEAHKDLSPEYVQELISFRTEAEQLLDPRESQSPGAGP